MTFKSTKTLKPEYKKVTLISLQYPKIQCLKYLMDKKLNRSQQQHALQQKTASVCRAALAGTASRSRAAIPPPVHHSGRPHLDTGPSLGLPSTGQTDKLVQAQRWRPRWPELEHTTCEERPHLSDRSACTRDLTTVCKCLMGQGGTARLFPEVHSKRTSINTHKQE